MWSDLTWGPRLQGHTRRAKLKSTNNSLIIGPRGLRCEINLYEIMGSVSDDVRFDPSFNVKRGQSK